MGLIPRIFSSLITIIEGLIVIECILSWVVRDNNELMNTIKTITSPILEPFRKLQYNFLGNTPIDISPIFAMVALEIIRKLVFIIL